MQCNICVVIIFAKIVVSSMNTYEGEAKKKKKKRRFIGVCSNFLKYTRPFLCFISGKRMPTILIKFPHACNECWLGGNILDLPVICFPSPFSRVFGSLIYGDICR